MGGTLCNCDMAKEATQETKKEAVNVYDDKHGTYKVSEGGKPDKATAPLPNTPSPFVVGK